jgi:hypothetical protein
MMYANWSAIFPWTIASVLSVMPPVSPVNSPAVANQAAREITVLIVSANQQSSGVLVAKADKTYYVLTAAQALPTDTPYQLITPDRHVHTVDLQQVRHLGQPKDSKEDQQSADGDLVLVPFVSDRPYSLAILADAVSLPPEQALFFSGWTKTTHPGEVIRQFGRISRIWPHGSMGYRVTYTNPAYDGMVGAPLVDSQGRLVGIHGGHASSLLTTLGLATDTTQKIAALHPTGTSYAIPVSSFLLHLAQAELNLSIQWDNAAIAEAMPPAISPATGPILPDPRDRIEDLSTLLQPVDSPVDVIIRQRTVLPY